MRHTAKALLVLLLSLAFLVGGLPARAAPSGQTSGTVSLNKAWAGPGIELEVTVRDADLNKTTLATVVQTHTMTAADIAASTTVKTITLARTRAVVSTTDGTAAAANGDFVATDAIAGTTISVTSRTTSGLFLAGDGFKARTTAVTVTASAGAWSASDVITITYAAQVDSASVKVTSSSDPTGFTVTLFDDDSDALVSDKFVGKVKVSGTASATTGTPADATPLVTTTLETIPSILALSGDTITFEYEDVSNSASASVKQKTTARVETVPPVVTQVSPASGLRSASATFELVADITDADSGVDKNSIRFLVRNTSDTPSGANECPGYTTTLGLKCWKPATTDDIKDITGGFRVTLKKVGGGGLTFTGTAHWYLAVKDLAGNVAVPETENFVSTDYSILLFDDVIAQNGTGGSSTTANFFAGCNTATSVGGVCPAASKLTGTRWPRDQSTSISLGRHPVVVAATTPVSGADLTDAAPLGITLAATNNSGGDIKVLVVKDGQEVDITTNVTLGWTTSSTSTGSITSLSYATSNTTVGDKIAKGTIIRLRYSGLSMRSLTIDSTAPTLKAAWTGETYSASKKRVISTLVPNLAGEDDGDVTATDSVKATSVHVEFSEGMDVASVVPAAFRVDGVAPVSVTAVAVSGGREVPPSTTVRSDVFLTMASPLNSGAKPKVEVVDGFLKDRTLIAMSAAEIANAQDGIPPALTVTVDKTLTNSSVKVTVTSEEPLVATGTPPVLKVSWIGDVAFVPTGLAVTAANIQRKKVQALDEVTKTMTLVTGTTNSYSYTFNIGEPPVGLDSADSTITTALAATDTCPGAGSTKCAKQGSANPSTRKVNLIVEAFDAVGNKGKVGKADPGDPKAITVHLDQVLNGGQDPEWTVSGTGILPDVLPLTEIELVQAPLFISAKFGKEGDPTKEYVGDNDPKDYSKVTVTKSTVEVTLTDGTKETLSHSISSADSITYTVSVGTPKLGTYEVTIQAKDGAGNFSKVAAAAVPQDLKMKFTLKAAEPYKVPMTPGWNLMSVPFSPSNPAINSVIPTTHPVDLVMTWDPKTETFLVSRRNATTKLFEGEVTAIEQGKAYFARTSTFEEIKVLLPPVAVAAAAPPPPPVVEVKKGWNLVPVISLARPIPATIPSATYFGSLIDGTTVLWTVAYRYDPTTTSYKAVRPVAGTSDASEVVAGVSVVRSGYGYWVFVSKDAVLTP